MRASVTTPPTGTGRRDLAVFGSPIFPDWRRWGPTRMAPALKSTSDTAPGGLAVALIFAALHLARRRHAAKWHEQHGHEQQAAAAEEAFRHLQAGYQQTAQPVLAYLTHRAPRATTASRFEQDLRAVLPDHADHILADRAWPALTTPLARAETAGRTLRRLLSEVGARRELDSAEHPAEVLNWRITAQPNRRAQAARRKSTISGTTSMSAAPRPPATPVNMAPEERGRHR